MASLNPGCRLGGVGLEVEVGQWQLPFELRWQVRRVLLLFEAAAGGGLALVEVALRLQASQGLSPGGVVGLGLRVLLVLRHLSKLLHGKPLRLGLVGGLAFVLSVNLSRGPSASASCAGEVGLGLGALLAHVLAAALLVQHRLHKLLLRLLLRGWPSVGPSGVALQVLETPHERQ